jgi:hypothetical protein
VVTLAQQLHAQRIADRAGVAPLVWLEWWLVVELESFAHDDAIAGALAVRARASDQAGTAGRDDAAVEQE